MQNKIILLLKIIGWGCFAMAVVNFTGIMDYFGTVEEANDALMFGIFSETFGIPDIQTIKYAIGSIVIGLILRKLTNVYDAQQQSGTRLIVCSLVCIALTFTPVSWISFLPAGMILAEEELAPDGYTEIDLSDGQLYAFLGSSKSEPEDVDIFDYHQGYDGHAKEAYDQYKICGWLINQSNENWFYVVMEFVLIDKNGDDILIDGQPVILTNAAEFESKFTVNRGMVGRFETNAIKAKKLPVQPVNFRVQSVRQAYFEAYESS